VAQGVGSEFKPQYCQKKKKNLKSTLIKRKPWGGKKDLLRLYLWKEELLGKVKVAEWRGQTWLEA
jgi:hypothetical protein